jgi:two-component system sensor histidine kinase UhpB
MQATLIDYETIIERVSDGFISFDKELNYVFVNAAACTLLNRTKDQLIGKNLVDVFPLSKNLPFVKKYFEAIDHKQTMQWEEYLHPYNRWFFNVIYPSDSGLSVFFKDISEQKNRELQLVQANERFELAALATDDVLWDWNIQTNSIWWNNRFKEIFLYEDDEIGSDIKSWEKRIHPEDVDKTLKKIYRCIETGAKTWSDEYRFLKKDGTYATLFDRGYIVYDNYGKAMRMIGAMMDISKQKKSEQELNEMNEQLRNLSTKLQRAIEEERRHIAREIHDELGQQLTLVKMEIAGTKKEFPNISEKGIVKIDSVLNSVDNVIKSLQRIASDLRPKMIDDLGLIATLEWYALDFEKRTGIHCELKLSFNDTLFSNDYLIAIFRIIQESLTNVIRYASASKVLIEAMQNHHSITFKITDNGVGFSVKNKTILSSLGLLGMRERARIMHADLSITSLPNRGTRIKLVVPLQNQHV